MPRAKSRKRTGGRGKIARQMELQVAGLPAKTKRVRGVKLKHVSAFTMLVSVICLSAFLAGRVDVSAAKSVRGDAKEQPMFLGLRTAVYDAPDIAKAKAWYSKVLGEQPYFDQPFYVGFNVGGYELGLLPEKDSAAKRARAGVAYWGAVSYTHLDVYKRQILRCRFLRAEKSPMLRMGSARAPDSTRSSLTFSRKSWR